MAGFSCFAESTVCAGADAGFSAGLAGFESVLSEGAASGAGSALLEVTSLDGFEGFDASAGLGASAAFAGDGSAAGFFGSVEASALAQPPKTWRPRRRQRQGHPQAMKQKRT